METSKVMTDCVRKNCFINDDHVDGVNRIIGHKSRLSATENLGTVLFSLEWGKDYWKQSWLVANSVHTTDKTRQSCRWCELGITLQNKRSFRPKILIYLERFLDVWTAPWLYVRGGLDYCNSLHGVTTCWRRRSGHNLFSRRRRRWSGRSFMWVWLTYDEQDNQ